MEERLNRSLNVEDRMCDASYFERWAEREDTRIGSYDPLELRRVNRSLKGLPPEVGSNIAET